MTKLASSNSWLKIYRKFLEWEWYDDINVKVLFLHILLKANYKDKKWHGIEIKRGSFLTTIRGLAKETGLTPMQVRTALTKLKITHEITQSSNANYTIISINNYDAYQGNNTLDNKPITHQQHTDNTPITHTIERIEGIERVEISKDMGDTTPVSSDNSLKEKREYGSADINKFIKGLNKYLQVKLPDDGRARRVAKNSLDLFTKNRKDGTVKEGREFMYDDKWENVKWFLAEYMEKRVKKGFSAQSWDTLYRNIKIWVANNGTLGDN